MAYTTEFKKQWKKLSDYLESEMIRASKEPDGIQVNQLAALLENEKKRWQVMGEYNYAWLEKLRRENAEVAAQFESALKSVRLAQEKPADKPSALLVVGPAAVGALVGFGVPALFKCSLTWILVGGIGLTAVAGYVGYNICKIKKEAAAAAERKRYLAQIEMAGEKLTAILKKTD